MYIVEHLGIERLEVKENDEINNESIKEAFTHTYTHKSHPTGLIGYQCANSNKLRLLQSFVKMREFRAMKTREERKNGCCITREL